MVVMLVITIGDDYHDNDGDDNNGDGADGKWEHHSDGDCEVLTVIVIATSWYIVSIFSSYLLL